MSHPALLKMLEKYDLSNTDSSFDALREVLQEIVLLGLYEAGFFKQAAFYGGTALRILHGLPRFSEDLDFSLLAVNNSFNLAPYKDAVTTTLNTFGFEVEIELKTKNLHSTIASAFVKGNTLAHLLNIQAPESVMNTIHHDKKVKIKLEVDTHPPLGFSTESIVRLSPRPFSVNAFTLPSLFAGKMHAVLCRGWGNRPKGRDWYDLIWYVANGVSLDLPHLSERLEQSCKYFDGTDVKFPTELTGKAVKELLLQRLEGLDIAKAQADVQPFIKDMRELELWSKDFFVAVFEQIKVEI